MPIVVQAGLELEPLPGEPEPERGRRGERARRRFAPGQPLCLPEHRGAGRGGHPQRPVQVVGVDVVQHRRGSGDRALDVSLEDYRISAVAGKQIHQFKFVGGHLKCIQGNIRCRQIDPVVPLRVSHKTIVCQDF